MLPPRTITILIWNQSVGLAHRIGSSFDLCMILYCDSSLNSCPYCVPISFSVSISGSNPNWFISGSCDTTARLWDTRAAGRAVQTFHGHKGDVNTVKFLPDGYRFGTGSEDGTCRLYDIRTGHQLQVYQPQGGDENLPVTSIAFSASGRLLFTGYASNNTCYVWDTLLGEVG